MNKLVVISNGIDNLIAVLLNARVNLDGRESPMG
jgi:hypothetical protein